MTIKGPHILDGISVKNIVCEPLPHNVYRVSFDTGLRRHTWHLFLFRKLTDTEILLELERIIKNGNLRKYNWEQNGEVIQLQPREVEVPGTQQPAPATDDLEAALSRLLVAMESHEKAVSSTIRTFRDLTEDTLALLNQVIKTKRG